MSDAVSFTVPGDPVGWQRPGVDTRRGRPVLYTQDKTLKYERKVARYALAAMWDIGARACTFTGPLVIVLRAYFKCPKSDERKRIPAPERPHTKKPDLDNVVKMIDALSGVVFKDDAQIVKIAATKMIAAQGQPGRPEITVRPYHERSLFDDD